ncbi:flavodoxin family protein [Thalassobacillus hwangdonensis]|uniref:Flavodoxin family protein n=1 Tax=Thalassobacillus hwangdonensis TaxID=546108 RepID=A0ABW3L2M9_9BACI
MKILVLSGSSRKNGNTDYMIDHLMNGVDYTNIHLADYDMKPIEDMRHTHEGFAPVDDDYEKLLQHFLDHDIIVFATPIYWFGMSGIMKTFIDRWSQYMRDERYDLKAAFAEKKAYVTIVGGSDPKITGLPLIQQFGHIFDFVHMDFIDYVIGYGVKPQEVKTDNVTLSKLSTWNEHFKQLQTK